MRPVPAQLVIAMTMTSTLSDGSSRRASTTISGSVGSTRNQFSNESMTRSVQPPK